MSDKVVLWKADSSLTSPLQVTADSPGTWPGHDDNGDQIYVNTHFKLEADAWESLIRNVKAYVSLAGSALADAKERVAKCEQECGKAAIQFGEVNKNYEKSGHHRAALERP
jgi:hypothetical protein